MLSPTSIVIGYTCFYLTLNKEYRHTGASARVRHPSSAGLAPILSPRRAVESALRELHAVGAPLVGAAFTQVDVKEQAKSGYGDAGYYYGSYSRYYLQ